MYADTIRITRPSGDGVQTPAGFVPGVPTVVYDGKCDLQDRARTVEQQALGDPKVRREALVYFPIDDGDGGNPANVLFSPDTKVELSDLAEVTTSLGVTRLGRISETRPMDQSVVVKWA